MGKTVRFLFQFAWVNLASLLGFAAFVFAGCYLTGVPGEPGNSNLFANYYAMFPAMAASVCFCFPSASAPVTCNWAFLWGRGGGISLPPCKA